MYCPSFPEALTMQTLVTGIPPVRRNRLWLHRRSLRVVGKIHQPSWWRLPDLHAICTRPASLLHTREMRCCNEGHARRRESAAAGGVARLRRAGASLLKSNLPERYPALLVGSGGGPWPRAEAV